MSKEINYTEAFDELQDIVTALEAGDVSLDDLSAKVKRAAILITICKEKLSSTDEDVNQILKEMNAKQTEDPEEFG
ncbi:MAG: exodeoxyribonuclease VII small subunit [Pseudopedobacter saltans]|uniref:Exodeoxyribonuclease VII small subunit n=1 Tax=Pseudopedobacter saltans TaxID=151895 RepID=A0A2W5EPY6_9SPHI|nr:MAG: exodeoxyribonuclease VII small subunit [Pseudopedobacter saltans]